MRQRTSGQRPRKCGYSNRHEVLVNVIGSGWDCKWVIYRLTMTLCGLALQQ